MGIYLPYRPEVPTVDRTGPGYRIVEKYVIQQILAKILHTYRKFPMFVSSQIHCVVDFVI